MECKTLKAMGLSGRRLGTILDGLLSCIIETLSHIVLCTRNMNSALTLFKSLNEKAQLNN